MKGLKCFYMVLFMLVMAVVLSFLPNTTLSTIGEYWVMFIVPFAFVVSGLVLKNWLDDERTHRATPYPIRQDVSFDDDKVVDVEAELVMCKLCNEKPATIDGYCEKCYRKAEEVVVFA